MTTYLVGMLYHEPESWALYQAGVIEDCESTTGIFVDASSPEEALAWGEKIAETLLRKSNNDESLDWKGLGYFCWIEAEPTTSNWKHCLSFFQHVELGEWPDFNALGSAAYKKWAEQNGIKYT
jgi:hypothetical protein